MNACMMCLQPLNGGPLYHPACAKAMFGQGGQAANNVRIDYDVRRVQTLTRKPNGQPLLAGRQCKLPVCVTADRRNVKIVAGSGNHILKPQNPCSDLPQIELVTMRVAEAAGVEIAPCALVPMADGSLALLVRRLPAAMDDFCTLAGKAPEAKYDGSGELCAQIVRDHATEPLVEMAKLFRRFVVAWWTGNGDMHLGDLALTAGDDGVRGLAPAYGLQCTRLVCTDDRLALPVGGKRRDFTRTDWLAFGERCGLRRPAVERVLCSVADSLDKALEIVANSPLAGSARSRFAEILTAQAA